MNEEQIKPIVQAYIDQAMAGIEKENPKLDFKRGWYDLTNEIEGNEFIKDASAIANTPGLDGFIIIGFDEKTNELFSTKFSDSKLKNSNELMGYINKRVDRAFQVSYFNLLINEHFLSVLHIPPSFDKPHVIRNYQNNKREEQHRVFIRNGSSTRIANKYDLDFIAYDRKNLMPEYSLHISSSQKLNNLNWISSEYKIKCDSFLTIENNGLRPVAINEISLNFYYDIDQQMEFISSRNMLTQNSESIKASNLIISPGSIEKYHIELKSKESFFNEDHKIELLREEFKRLKNIDAAIKINTGRVLQLKLELY
jgi:hypothetical protein